MKAPSALSVEMRPHALMRKPCERRCALFSRRRDHALVTVLVTVPMFVSRAYSANELKSRVSSANLVPISKVLVPIQLRRRLKRGLRSTGKAPAPFLVWSCSPASLSLNPRSDNVILLTDTQANISVGAAQAYRRPGGENMIIIAHVKFVVKTTVIHETVFGYYCAYGICTTSLESILQGLVYDQSECNGVEDRLHELEGSGLKLR